jgi:hypothetical protein
MNRALVYELQEIVDEVEPPLIELEQLHRLVAAEALDDEAHDDDECTAHEGCRPARLG